MRHAPLRLRVFARDPLLQRGNTTGRALDFILRRAQESDRNQPVNSKAQSCFFVAAVTSAERYAKKMKKALILLLIAALLIFLDGMGKLSIGEELPVYTDPHAPEVLSSSLEKLPREQRFAKWYHELRNYETAHKRLTDLGRGLIALALGISLGALFLYWLQKVGEKRRWLLVSAYWVILWAVRFPLTIWYYSVRQERFDYPVWGDSIAIGVFQDYFMWVCGFALLTGLLLVLMNRYKIPPTIRFRVPHGASGWTRTIILWLWLLLLVACIYPGVGDGDEGMAFSCAGAIPVILIALSAIPHRQNEASLVTPDTQPVQSVDAEPTPLPKSEHDPEQA